MEQILIVVFIVAIGWVLLKGFRSDSKNERNEVKECRHCHNMIPYRASVCPYCHRDPGTDIRAEGRLFKNGFSTKLIVGALLIMGVCVFLMVLFGG